MTESRIGSQIRASTRNTMYLQILIPIILAILAYVLGRFRDNNKQIFDKKLDIYSNIVIEINTHSYSRCADRTESCNTLIKLFAPARLIGSKEVVDELREYFSLISEYFDLIDGKVKNKIMDKISNSAMELEQLMREDLRKNRYLSKIRLFLHCRISKKV